VNFGSVAAALGGRDARLAPSEDAAAITGCTMGAVPPFSFHEDLQVIVDGALLEETEIVFNAGRLDQSIFLATEDYRRITRPLTGSISARQRDAVAAPAQSAQPVAL
jgi:Ala-tRNA(Pro) deacylase